MGKYDSLKLENQICFPLYACAKEVIKKYTPYLDELGLTYTQYIVLMVLWGVPEISVKELGEKLFLDSGTLTPLLKKLKAKGLIHKTRDPIDERALKISLTDEGVSLRDKVVNIPPLVANCLDLAPDEAMTLYTLLYKVLRGL